MNKIYMVIPEPKVEDFLYKTKNSDVSRVSAIRKDAYNNIIAEFNFSTDMNDIRVHYLAYNAIEVYYNLGKVVYKNFNKIQESDFIKYDLIYKPEEIDEIDLITLIDYALFYKKKEVVNNFCKRTGVYRINYQPGVFKIEKEVPDHIKEIMEFDNTYIKPDIKNKNLLVIAFTYKNTDFGDTTDSKDFNIEIKHKDDRIDRAIAKCQLLNEFTNGIGQYNEVTLRFLLSNIIQLMGGWAFYKKQMEVLNIPKAIKDNMDKLKTVYNAKGTQYRCSKENCPHYKDCLNKKIYNTTELIHGTYEQIKPINLITREEAKDKLNVIVKNAMNKDLDIYNMVCIMVSTGLGKTQNYTSWVVDTLLNNNNRKIDIIAVPTLALAKQVKDTIQEKIKAARRYNEVSTYKNDEYWEIRGIARVINPFKSEDFGDLYDNNKYKEASAILHEMIESIIDKDAKTFNEQTFIQKMKKYKIVEDFNMNIYVSEELIPILEKINPQLAEDYEFYNKIGAYNIASRIVFKKAKEITESTEKKTQAEIDLMRWVLAKKQISEMKDKDGLYIVTHEWLALQKEASKLENKTIVIDEDIFNSLNKLDELDINELDIIASELKTQEQKPVVKEAIKLVENMKNYFNENCLNLTDAKVPQFMRKEKGGLFDIYHISNKEQTVFDVIVQAIYNVKIVESNVLGIFNSEYMMRDGNKIVYNIRRDLSEKAKYIMFSATADEKMYNRLFETRAETQNFKVKYENIGAVKQKGIIEQYLNITGSKTQLKIKDENGVTNAERIMRAVNEYMNNDVKFITFKSIIEDFKFKEDLNNIEIIDSMCLGNTAGYDELKGENTCILGNIRTPEKALFLYAISLGIDLRDSGELKYRTVEYNEFKFKYYSYTNNEDLNHLLIWLSDRETKQAVGRSRAIWFDCRVILFSPIPNAEAIRIEKFDVDIIKPKFNKNKEFNEILKDISISEIEDFLNNL